MPPILKVGSQGAAVQAWQAVLIKMGFALEPDGVFGPATERATRDFQKREGITLDGVVGPDTQRCAAIRISSGLPLAPKVPLPIAPPPHALNTLGQYPQEIYQTPNYSASMRIRPSGIVIHHTCGTWAGDAAWVMNPGNPSRNVFASYHCLINRDGARRQFARDEHRCWHAGSSMWRGRSDCNSWMLGVAFSGDTYPDRRHGFTINSDQIASLVEWCKERVTKYNIAPEMITDHRQIAPARKDDINPAVWPAVIGAVIVGCYG